MKPQIDSVYYSKRKDEHLIILAHDTDPDILHALSVVAGKPRGLSIKVNASLFRGDDFLKLDKSPFTKTIAVEKLSLAAERITKKRFEAIEELVKNPLIYDQKKGISSSQLDSKASKSQFS